MDRIESKYLVSLIGVLILVGTIFLALPGLGVLQYIITQYIVDDTFYYLLPAFNLGHGAGLSFDGTHLTNGFQPLWMVLLIPLGALIDNREWMLRSTLIYQACLFAVSTGLIAYTALRKQLAFAAIAIPVLWLAFGFRHDLGISLVTNGLESALFYLVLAASFITTLQTSTGGGSTSLHALILTLLVLTRFDALFFAAPAWIYVVWRRSIDMGWKRSIQDYWPGILLGCVSLLIYVAWSMESTGLLMPVSGQIKLWQAEQMTAEQYGSITTPLFINQVSRVFATSAGLILSVVLTALTLPSDSSDVTRTQWISVAGQEHLAITLLSLLLIPLLLYLMMRPQRTAIAQWRGAAAVLGLGAMLHLLVHSITLWPFAHYNVWHYGGQYFVILLALVTAIESILRRLQQHSPVLAILTLIIILTSVISVQGPTLQRSFTALTQPISSFPTERLGLYRAALWTNENLPDDVLLGAFNAGIAGYFSDAPLINLDGLINDATIFNYIRQGTSIGQYIDEEGIDYIIDYSPQGAYPLPEVGRIYYADLYTDDSAAFVMSTGPQLAGDTNEGLLAAWPVTVVTSTGQEERWVGTIWGLTPDELDRHQWIVTHDQHMIAGPFSIESTWFRSWPPPPRHPEFIVSYQALPAGTPSELTVESIATDAGPVIGTPYLSVELDAEGSE